MSLAQLQPQLVSSSFINGKSHIHRERCILTLKRAMLSVFIPSNFRIFCDTALYLEYLYISRQPNKMNNKYYCNLISYQLVVFTIIFWYFDTQLRWMNINTSLHRLWHIYQGNGEYILCVCVWNSIKVKIMNNQICMH